MRTTYLKYLPLFFAATPLFAAGADPTVTEIAPYVYPENAPAAPATGIFMPDGMTYLLADEDLTKIKKFDIKTGNEIETIFDASHTREAKISSFDSFSVSPDGSRLLIAVDSRPVYRRSSTAVYYVFDIKRNILKPLSREYSRQQAPLFSPDGRMVAFVAGNDISLRKLDYDTEIKVTDDGKANSIINGIPDWTYEEEFSTSCSMVWSPDNTVLCFIRYDETDVPLYSFPLYQGSCHPMNEYAEYPGTFSYKYPVAGQPNSIVSVRSYDVSTRKTVELPLSQFPVDYIPRIDFAPGGDKLFVTTLNRDQNRMEIFSVNPKSTISSSVIVEESRCWLDTVIYEDIVFTSTSVIINSSRSGYNNLYEYSLTGSLLRNITPFSRDITRCYGVAPDGTVYYQSVTDTPTRRAVYRTDRKLPEVAVSSTDGTVSAIFTPGMKFCYLTKSNAATPPVTSLYSTDNLAKPVREIESNSAYASRWSTLPKKEFVRISSDGVELDAYIIKPTDFDPSRRYPVIMTQYSGPGAQQVLDRWSLDWEQFAATKGYIVACVDPRGSGGHGREFMDVVYRNLGHYETVDQINAARYLASLPYVDASRIGICGWSYGGYETLMCATAENNPFKVAVAIAPVTDWRYYDTVYAERYMLTPRQNEDGYRNSAPMTRADSMTSKLLIMSGTADDNVHLSNTMEFVSRLQANGILCDMFLFPNMNHSIFGCNSRAVVYGKMLDYFNRNL